MKTEALKLADELDEASELEADLNRPENQADLQKASAMIRRLVEELDKQGEPVAVIYQHPDDLRPAIRFTKPFAYKSMVVVNPDIPLYTTPQTKPLSDAEIKELSELTSDPDPTDFVRAIEERHGIK